MGLFSSKPKAPRRALTASAAKLGLLREGRYMSRMGQPWQLRALTYYDQIGEIRFASQFYAKLLSGSATTRRGSWRTETPSRSSPGLRWRSCTASRTPAADARGCSTTTGA